MHSITRPSAIVVIVLLLLTVGACGRANLAAADDDTTDSAAVRKEALLGLLASNSASQLAALERLDRHWDNHLTPALLEFISLTPSVALRNHSLQILRRRTGQDFGYDLNGWFSWVWMQNFPHPPYYAEFKSRLYREIDPRFGAYFAPDRASDIQLDEVRWGGVVFKMASRHYVNRK